MKQSARSANPTLRILTTDGLEFVSGLNAAEASNVGSHWNAIRRYLEWGETKGLQHLQGVRVAGRILETRPEVIEWHATRGDVSFESIYDEVV